MQQKASLRELLKAHKVQVGMFGKLNCGNVVEMIGMAGFDFVIFDTEHANFSPCDIENLIRAADSVGLNSVVRVRDTTPESVLHALDSGAGGVQIPGITSMEMAARVCRSSKYPPEGDRGNSMAQRSARYGMWDREENYYAYANKQSAVIAHVENLEMYEQVAQLAQLPQLDVLFIGPGDLSQAIGKPGQLDAPELQPMIRHIIDVGLSAGKAVGIFCPNLAAVKKYVEMGITYIALGSDVSCLGKALRQLKCQADEALT